MERYFTKTFFHFLAGFLTILCVSYGIFLAAVAISSTPVPSNSQAVIDNVTPGR